MYAPNSSSENTELSSKQDFLCSDSMVIKKEHQHDERSDGKTPIKVEDSTSSSSKFIGKMMSSDEKWEKMYLCYKCCETFGSGYLLTVHAKTCHTSMQDLIKGGSIATYGHAVNEGNDMSGESVMGKNGGVTAQDHTYVQSSRTLYPLKVGATIDRPSSSGQASHVLEKLHRCGVCLRGFYWRDQLRRHHRQHAAQQSYACKHCGKRFCDKTTLRVHKRWHLREPPFLCASCDKSFNLLNMLRFHCKQTHSSTASSTSRAEGHISSERLESVSWQIDVNIKQESVHEVTRVQAALKPAREQGQQQTLSNCLKQIRARRQDPSEDNPGKLGKSANCDPRENHWHRAFPCNTCTKTFRSTIALKIHKENCGNCGTPTGRWNFKCRLCGIRVQFWSLLQAHLKSHQLGLHKCTKCGKTCMSKDELISHVASVHRVSRTTKGTAKLSASLCPVCGKLFKSESAMKTHVATHTDKKPYKCNACSKAFALKNYLSRHKVVHTTRPLSYVCETCKKAFNNRIGLKVHMKTHSGEKPFACTLCDKTFTTKAALPGHMRTHTGEKPYACKICDRTFVLKSALAKHEVIHNEVRPYQCNLCDMSYATRQMLDRHLNSHIGLKPFECEVCEQKFTQKFSLKNHMMLHTGSKPFVCEDCGKSFRNASGLREHRNTHTGERPFKCPFCVQGFTTSGNRRYHLKVFAGGTCKDIKPGIPRQNKWQSEKYKNTKKFDDQSLLTTVVSKDSGQNDVIMSGADKRLNADSVTSLQPVTSGHSYSNGTSGVQQSNNGVVFAHKSESNEENQWDVETYQINVGSIDPHGNEAAILESLQNCLEAHQAKSSNYSINISDLISQETVEDGSAVHLNRAVGQSIDLGDTQIIFVEQDVESMGNVVIIPQ